MPTARRSLHCHATSHSPLALVRIVRSATCSGSRARSQAVTTQFSRGQSGRLWDTLVPADQAVSRARYMACQHNEGFEIQKFNVLETYTDKIDVGGRPTRSTAASVQVTSDDGLTTATMHTVSVRGTWRWALPAADLAAFQQATCPTS